MFIKGPAMIGKGCSFDVVLTKRIKIGAKKIYTN